MLTFLPSLWSFSSISILYRSILIFFSILLHLFRMTRFLSRSINISDPLPSHREQLKFLSLYRSLDSFSLLNRYFVLIQFWSVIIISLIAQHIFHIFPFPLFIDQIERGRHRLVCCRKYGKVVDGVVFSHISSTSSLIA